MLDVLIQVIREYQQIICGCSSGVELLLAKQTVTGSNPVIRSNIGLLVKWLIRLPVTQKSAGSIPAQVAIMRGQFSGRAARLWGISSEVEHCLYTAGVTGSIPVSPTSFLFLYLCIQEFRLVFFLLRPDIYKVWIFNQTCRCSSGVEQLISNQSVGSSNLSNGTIMPLW